MVLAAAPCCLGITVQRGPWCRDAAQPLPAAVTLASCRGQNPFRGFSEDPCPLCAPIRVPVRVRRLAVRLLAVPQDPHPLLAPSATFCATFGGTGQGEDVAGASTGWQGRGGGSAGPPPAPRSRGWCSRRGGDAGAGEPPGQPAAVHGVGSWSRSCGDEMWCLGMSALSQAWSSNPLTQISARFSRRVRI